MAIPQSIPCMIIRGGTSRGPFFRAEDLPSDAIERDALLARSIGGGHPSAVDGIGGGSPSTCKVAIVGRSARSGMDLDYLFAQVDGATGRVDTSPNCGNMLAGVGPFAIEAGLVEAAEGQTSLRIHNVNTGTRVDALIQTPGRRVRYEGQTRIAGVPGAGSPIRLSFHDMAGSISGRILPTGAARDVIDGIGVTCVDMAVPAVLVPAAALNLNGTEDPGALDSDLGLLHRLEGIRLKAGRLMGLGDVRHRVVPKIGLVSPPRHGGTISARYLTPWRCHSSLAITGGICIAAASAIRHSVAHDAGPLPDGAETTAHVEHPSGVLAVDLRRDPDGVVSSAHLIRTARLIFKGQIFV